MWRSYSSDLRTCLLLLHQPHKGSVLGSPSWIVQLQFPHAVRSIELWLVRTAWCLVKVQLLLRVDPLEFPGGATTARHRDSISGKKTLKVFMVMSCGGRLPPDSPVFCILCFPTSLSPAWPALSPRLNLIQNNSVSVWDVASVFSVCHPATTPSSVCSLLNSWIFATTNSAPPTHILHCALCYSPTTGACKILLFHTDCTWLNMVYRYNKEYCVKCCAQRSPASWRQSWKEEEALWVSTSFLQIAGVKVFS